MSPTPDFPVPVWKGPLQEDILMVLLSLDHVNVNACKCFFCLILT